MELRAKRPAMGEVPSRPRRVANMWENFPRQLIEEKWDCVPRKRRYSFAMKANSRGQSRLRIADAAAKLHAPLARLLRPLVRLCIRGGMTFPALTQLFRELFVNVAEHDFALEGKEQTDSRVSLLTGIHRKEVARLRGAGAPVNETPATLSLTSA